MSPSLQAQPPHDPPMCSEFDPFLLPASKAKPEGLLSWIRGPPSPKASRPLPVPSLGELPGSPLCLILLHRSSNALLFLPPRSALQQLRADLQQGLLTACLALRPQLLEEASQDAHGAAEAAVLTQVTAGERCARVWLVGRREAEGREIYAAFPEAGTDLRAVLAACEAALFGCGAPVG